MQFENFAKQIWDKNNGFQEFESVFVSTKKFFGALNNKKHFMMSLNISLTF